MVRWDRIDEQGKREELEKTLEYLSSTYPEIKEPQFRQLKRLYELRPKYNIHKAQTSQTENMPRKSIFKNRAKTSDPAEAILELMDNIFDNYIENIEQNIINHHLKITLFFYGAGEETGVLIDENSGGISVSKKKALIILGERGDKPDNLEMIGTWGEAFLYSIYNLGQAAEITSYFPGHPPFLIKISRDFFSIDDSPWFVSDSVFEDPADIQQQPGTTTIYINGLKPKFNTNRLEVFEDLLKKLERTYWKKVYDLRKRGYDVKVNIEAFGNEPIISSFDPIIFNDIFSFFPLYKPIYLRNFKIYLNPGEIDGEENEYLLVDAYCGINPFWKHEFTGVWLYGNGRLFEESIKDMHIGYGYERTELPSLDSRRTTEMIAIFLFFKSPKPEWNYLIPWRSPAKKGFNPQSPIQDKLIDLISLLVDRLLLPVKSLKNPRPISIIFTKQFVNSSIDEKYDFIKNLGIDKQNKGFFPLLNMIMMKN